MRAGKFPLGSGIFKTSRVSVALTALIVALTILALAGLAMSQTIVYKTPNRAGRGWSDGTMGGGYVKPDPNYRPDHTADGQPDIQGFWAQRTFANQLDSSIEALPNNPKVQTRVFDPPDGKIPYQPWARAMRADFFDHYIDPHAACVPVGVPRQMASAATFQIIQLPGQVLLITDNSENFRHIPLDGHPHIGKNLMLWMGDSRGRWEGNTLVIDTTNLDDASFLSIQGDFHSDKLHVTERITPIDADTIQYEATLDDPGVYDRPWKEAFPVFRSRNKKYEMLEENCAEGNRSVESQIEAGRKIYPGLAQLK